MELKGKNILVTGATGFIGSHVAHSLLENGFHVTAFTSGRANPWRLSAIQKDISWISLTDHDSLASALSSIDRVDAFINTAVSYGRSGESLAELARANVCLPLEIAERLSGKGLEVFINADTFYPPTRDSYSLSKRQLTDWLPALARTKRIGIANVMLQHVYGPRDGDTKFIPSIIKACLRNEKSIDLTLGEQTRDFVYVSDVAEAFVATLQSTFLEKGECLQMEIGSGSSVSLRQAVELIKAKTNSASTLRFGALEYAPNEIMHACANLKAAKSIGWVPKTDLENGILNSIAWYSEHKEAV